MNPRYPDPDIRRATMKKIAVVWDEKLKAFVATYTYTSLYGDLSGSSPSSINEAVGNLIAANPAIFGVEIGVVRKEKT